MAKFLGDIVNEKGSNTDMVYDKVRKAQAAMASNLAMCNEVTMGVHFVSTAMLLYQTVFMATLLSNSQAWRRLTVVNIKAIETIQLRYLKRVMKAPLSTPNAFVFLEFGTLPASATIHTRQLTFLRHILLLEECDPVKMAFNEQKQLPHEKNWANEVTPLIKKYHLEDIHITAVSEQSWKQNVTENIARHTFSDLIMTIENIFSSLNIKQTVLINFIKIRSLRFSHTLAAMLLYGIIGNR